MSGEDYPLDLVSAARYIATELDRVAPAALSLDELATNYRHSIAADLARVRRGQNLRTDEEAARWLIARALEELERRGKRGQEQIATDGNGGYRFADGVRFEDLRFRRQSLHRNYDAHAQLRDPFNPMSGAFADNIRQGPDRDDLTELRDSMRAFGWLPELPAIKDERGVILVGHRRLRVAAELGIEPVTRAVRLGSGDEADARRLAISIASNVGQRPLTPENRKRIAEYLYGERDWTMARIGEALQISARTVSEDLKSVQKTERRGRPRKATDEQAAAIIEGHFEQGKPMRQLDEEVLGESDREKPSWTVRRVVMEERARRERVRCICPNCGNEHEAT